MNAKSKRGNYYSQAEIERIKAETSPVELALSYGLHLIPSGGDFKALCPFHDDKNPSLFVRQGEGDGNPAYKCFGCGFGGDVIKFVEKFDNLTFPGACEKLGGVPDGGQTSERSNRRLEPDRKPIKNGSDVTSTRPDAFKEPRDKAAERKEWPDMCLGQAHDLQELADLRGLPREACALAQAAGVLRFCSYPQMRNVDPPSPLNGPHRLMWVIQDETCAQIRRLDGQEIDGVGKAMTLRGSELHPIGLTESSKPVFICEGGPDYLASWARLWKIGKHEEFEPVCMLGTSASLGKAARRLKGREVWICAHNDDDERKGKAAAGRWAQEAIEAGAADVKIITPTKHKDFNDYERAVASH